ncbi:hypothetical protein CP863_06440 [Cutibacterium acnes]|uniref:Uncharacterized protein n=1 Tax=Cutibacterium acnes TaxID=1747 RepID=A0AAD0VNH7_CUTAC|nr:hypothetical protein TIB1ST10_04485 [Cutibacterium acnes 6609]ALT36439.1 hypothetical protein ALW21_04395 [Cutibacterium acnes]EFT77547.1 hypothetical protein HMPREF9601_02034 [Cutibacterium acnes HL030PA1]ESS85767.1 hypothetical protein H498_12077 [Cutibacterium acnes P6]MCM4182706.1 hypothetical protein [Cutibacterium acnes P06B]MCU7482952.1 hypothetical protein [Cutibacterium acnes PA20B]OFR52851.1 hypothetical protein HMPREF2882_09145 [Propionibacterium sp. HMSC078F10]QAZ50826.1 hypot
MMCLWRSELDYMRGRSVTWRADLRNQFRARTPIQAISLLAKLTISCPIQFCVKPFQRQIGQAGVLRCQGQV